jgi:hypothetical protein
LSDEASPRTALYLLLFTIQIACAIFVVGTVIPAFRELSLHLGEQSENDSYDRYTTIFVLLSMQAAYWYRFLAVPIPFRTPNAILSHLSLFIGRMSFIFGAALFSLVIFRHLPELGKDVDLIISTRRGLLLFGLLFALFCFTLEWERLGTALGDHRSN